MKQSLLFLLIAVTITFTFSGCKKEKAQLQFIKGNINGVNFDCNKDLRASPSYVSDRFLQISGSWAAGSIELEISQTTTITVGTYEFEANKHRRGMIWMNGLYYAGDNGILGYLSGSGRITITHIDNDYVSGTFQFVTEPDFVTGLYKTVKNGQFSVRRN